jgi:hypothetical protein
MTLLLGFQAGDFAADPPEFTFEIAHSSLVGIFTDHPQDGRVGKADLLSVQSSLFKLARDQKTPGNL